MRSRRLRDGDGSRASNRRGRGNARLWGAVGHHGSSRSRSSGGRRGDHRHPARPHRGPANPYLDYVVTTGIGHARNLAVVSSGDAVIAIGGSYGTLAEIGLAARVGRPVVILSGWRLQNDDGTDGIWYASSPREALALIRQALLPGRRSDGAAAR